MLSPIFWVFLVIVIVILGALMLRKKECKLYKEDGKCVDECKNKIWDFTTKSCVESCPSGTKEFDEGQPGWLQCHKLDISKCESTKAVKFTTEGIKCVDECGSDDITFIDGSEKLCIEKCDGYIHPVTFKCLDSCGGDYPYEVTETDSYGVIFKGCSDKQR